MQADDRVWSHGFDCVQWNVGLMVRHTTEATNGVNRRGNPSRAGACAKRDWVAFAQVFTISESLYDD